MHDEVWFESAGTKLHAIAQGRGRPIVALHGGLADHRAALAYAGPLAESYRLITPDVRGAGRSVDAGPLSWDRLADDLAALLDHLGLARAVVAGTSAGSGAALRFALRHGDRLAGLVVLAPVYPGTWRELDEAPKAAMARMDDYAQRALAARDIAVLQPLFETLPEELRARALAMLASFDVAGVAATTHLLRSSQPFDRLEQLSAIHAPVLLVPGRDPQHPAALAQLYAEAIAHAKVVEAEGPQMVAAIDEFARTIAAW